MPDLSKLRQVLRSRRILVRLLLSAIYFVLILLVSALEHEDEILRLAGIGECDRVTFPGRDLYQRFSTSVYRNPRPHFVKLIVLSHRTEPSDVFDSACRKREFVAAILRRLQDIGPSVIVLDFWYPSEYCRTGKDLDATVALTSSVADASKRIPIVVGETSKIEQELEILGSPDLAELKKAGFGRGDQILDSQLEFSGQNVTHGLVRFNCDTRRVPMFWWVYESTAAASKPPTREPSLSFAAATRFDHNLANVLRRAISKDEHPLTNFIPEAQFEPLSAIDVVCGGGTNSGADWRRCQAPDLTQLGLRGKVIVIGERESDLHESALGRVPGYLIHANYIESLLDDRVFRPVPASVEIILGAAVILFVAMIGVYSVSLFTRLRWLLEFACIAISLSYLFSIHFGFFLVFWIPVIPILFFEFLLSCVERLNPHVYGEPSKSTCEKTA